MYLFQLAETKQDVEALFIDPQVQLILRRVTGFDIDKIFRTKKTLDPEPPKYKLLTDNQLEKVNKMLVVATLLTNWLDFFSFH